MEARDYPADLPGPDYKTQLVWSNVTLFALIHLGVIYTIMFAKPSWATILWCEFFISTFVLAKAMMKSYKARLKKNFC
jgi:hypothetical protein